jgi:hypothetical protein
MKKTILLSLFSFLVTVASFGQITTSTLSGTVKNEKGEVLQDASVYAVHQPTGTNYKTRSNKSGVYFIPAVRPGGPLSPQRRVERAETSLGADNALSSAALSGDRVGGTWRENTYPGLTCDVPSHAYTYSFEPNPDWTHMLPPGREIQEYFERTTRKYGVDRIIRFNQEITSCEYRGGRWYIRTRAGLEDSADIVIAATGVLHHINVPRIPGMESFGGASFHTARWDHSVPLEGRRVGVIGNGSTGVQIVSALAGRAAVRLAVAAARPPSAGCS